MTDHIGCDGNHPVLLRKTVSPISVFLNRRVKLAVAIAGEGVPVGIRCACAVQSVADFSETLDIGSPRVQVEAAIETRDPLRRRRSTHHTKQILVLTG